MLKSKHSYTQTHMRDHFSRRHATRHFICLLPKDVRQSIALRNSHLGTVLLCLTSERAIFKARTTRKMSNKIFIHFFSVYKESADKFNDLFLWQHVCLFKMNERRRRADNRHSLSHFYGSITFFPFSDLKPMIDETQQVSSPSCLPLRFISWWPREMRREVKGRLGD